MGASAEQLQIIRSKHVVYNYKLPASLQRPGCAKTVGMRELTSEEEIRAIKLGDFDYMRAQYEATKMAICVLDGKPVDVANNEADVFFEQIGAKGRTLLMKAHNKLSGPSKEEETDFFKSEAVAV